MVEIEALWLRRSTCTNSCSCVGSSVLVPIFGSHVPKLLADVALYGVVGSSRLPFAFISSFLFVPVVAVVVVVVVPAWSAPWGRRVVVAFSSLLHPVLFPFAFVAVSSFSFSSSFLFLFLPFALPFSFLPCFDVVDSFFFLLCYEGNVTCGWIGTKSSCNSSLLSLSLVSKEILKTEVEVGLSDNSRCCGRLPRSPFTNVAILSCHLVVVVTPSCSG